MAHNKRDLRQTLSGSNKKRTAIIGTCCNEWLRTLEYRFDQAHGLGKRAQDGCEGLTGRIKFPTHIYTEKGLAYG